MFSSASAVSSAICCWTSCSAGRERLPKRVASSDHERDRQQRQSGELGLDREHHDRGEHDRQNRLDDEDQAVPEEEAHGLQVDCRARHQLPGLLAVEERQLEPLELGVEEVAQVELDAERDAARDEAAGDAQAEAEHACAGDRDHPDDELVAVVAAHRVDRVARQRRDRDGHDHRARGERERRHDARLEGRQEAEHPSEDEHDFRKYSEGAMDRDPTRHDQPGPQAGLCDGCSHQQLVRNTRGSVFSLCRRSRTEPGLYRRYPPLPVISCNGYEPRAIRPGAG